MKLKKLDVQWNKTQLLSKRDSLSKELNECNDEDKINQLKESIVELNKEIDLLDQETVF